LRHDHIFDLFPQGFRVEFWSATALLPLFLVTAMFTEELFVFHARRRALVGAGFSPSRFKVRRDGYTIAFAVFHDCVL